MKLSLPQLDALRRIREGRGARPGRGAAQVMRSLGRLGLAFKVRSQWGLTQAGQEAIQ